MTEHSDRTGSAPDDGPLDAPPGPSAETDRETESGLPEGAAATGGEGTPLGVEEADPDGEGEPARGEDAMPGIPSGSEPPSAG